MLDPKGQRGWFVIQNVVFESCNRQQGGAPRSYTSVSHLAELKDRTWASAVSAPVVKMPKRQLYFAPIDLVEDRTRTRVVGVGVMMEVTSGRRVLLRVASGGIADAYVHGD